MLTKSIIWLLVCLGSFTAIWLAASSYINTSIVIPGRYQRPEWRLSPFADTNSAGGQFHDSSHLLRIGKAIIQIYPRRWATYLIVIGVLLTMVGLVFVLHIPKSNSAP